MHLFQSPWLRNAATSTRHPARRTGTARRIATLLQLEAQRKAEPELTLAPAPQACAVIEAAPRIDPIAA